MKSTLFFIVAINALLNLTAVAVPWVSRHGMTGAGYQSEFNTWCSAPYNYRLVSIAGYEEAGQARFAAVWEKKAGPGWVSHHALTLAQFDTQTAAYKAQDLYPTFVSGFAVGGQAYYNAIWEHLPGADIVSQAGMSYNGYVAENSNRISQGYKLVFLWTFTAGGSDFYNAVWRKGVSEGYAVRVRRTAADYQTQFNLLGGDGYQLIAVSTSHVGGEERYTGVWKKPADAAWYSFHALTPANYQGATWNAYYTGFRPVFASAFNTAGGGLRFNAIFHYNNGMGLNHLATIDNTINNYMQDKGIPGLSLAISKNGRLVYAKGFGQADQSVGEWVHPHHRFRQASVSKPVTAAAILKLRDEGSLTLNQKVFGNGALLANDYGNLAYSNWEVAMNVSNLLHHTTGWNTDGKLWDNAYGTDHAAILDWQLDNANPVAFPGLTNIYNNMNYIAAGRIIEKLTGKTYEQYVIEKILAPCCANEMEIGGQTLAERRPNEVVYYGSNPYVNIHPGRMDANGGWIGRPMDLLMFLRRINSGPDQSDILQAASQTAMRTGSSANMGYGLGLVLGGSWWGHNGAMDGTIAYAGYRNDGLAFAFACNTRPAGDSFAWGLQGIVDDLIDDLEAAKAWPSYDLFPCPNPQYFQWANIKFRGVIQHVQLQEEVWGPGADPDGDALVNAVEAYFNLDPMRPSTLPFEYALDRNDFVVRWTRPAGDRGVELISKHAPIINPRAWMEGPDIRSFGGAAGGPVTEETRIPHTARPHEFQKFEIEVK